MGRQQAMANEPEEEFYGGESSTSEGGAEDEAQQEETLDIPETESVQQTSESASGQQGEFRVRIGQRFRGISNDTGEVFSGKVLSRGGKGKGLYKHWYNVKRDDGTIQCVDFKESLRDLEEIPENVEIIFFQY